MNSEPGKCQLIMIDTPLVSVLMTSYNREKFIAESIESVLSSTYTNFELIIVDDCSTDKTFSIAKEYEAKDKRVKAYLNGTNLKDYPNRNKAASLAKGKYLKYLDSDDIIYPWGLEAMVYCMESFPEASYGLTSYDIKNSGRLPLLYSNVSAYYAFYFQRSFISCGPSGSIIRKDIFEKIGGFSGKPYIGDTELWLKLSKKYFMIALPLDLAWWRQHDEQQIRYEYKNRELESKRYYVFLEALLADDCPLKERYKEAAIRNLKNLNARNMVKYLVQGKSKQTVNLLKYTHLSLGDIIRSCRRNTYPPVI